MSACSRCNGLMVLDDIADFQFSFLPQWVPALRCIMCGNIEDPTIVQNRALKSESHKKQRLFNRPCNVVMTGG